MPQRFRTSARRARIFTVAAVGILCGLLTACAPIASTPVPTPTLTATSIPDGDGVLTIGTLFPTTGATAYLAKAQAAGVELAVREINEAGGVNGKPVVVYHMDSGDESTTKAEESFDALVSRGVDVIIGPSSLGIAERLLPEAISAGVAMISTSITAPILSDLDDNGMLFRVIPSRVLEGTALAKAFDSTSKVAVIYYLDDESTAVKDRLETELDFFGGTLIATLGGTLISSLATPVVAVEGFSETSNDADNIVAVLTAAAPDAVVLISPLSAMDKNKSILLVLSEANLAGEKLWLTSQNLANYSQELPEGTLTGVNGILEGAIPDDDFLKRVKSADPTITNFRYAAEAYDATILAAIAAVVSGKDSGRAVASVLQDVSTGGITCTSFGECVDVLTARTDIDYDGITGPIDFDRAGDPRSATYGIYRYEANNKFAFVDSVLVGK